MKVRIGQFCLILFSVLVFVITPVQAADGLVPCGRGDGDPCTLCHLIKGVYDIIQWGMSMMTYIGIAILVAMGILYIVSAGNQNLINTAKNGIKTTLIGFAVILLGWLMVNTIMQVLAKSDLGIGVTSWNSFTCDTSSSATQGLSSAQSPSSLGGASLSEGGGGGNGSCQKITDDSNPCSVNNLKRCSAWNAEAMSQICNVESGGGNATAVSGTDHCPRGGPSVSGGLFQINTTVHGPGCGQGLQVADPPLRKVSKDANGKWGDPNCRIKSESTLQTCMTQTKTAAWNIDRACEIYKKQGLGAWGYSAKKCGLR